MSSRLSIAIRIFLVIAITVGSLLAAAVPAFGQAAGAHAQDATETIVPVTATQGAGQPNSWFPTYSLNIYVNGNGWTSPNAGYYPGYSSGTIVSISATPANGWTFAGWSGPVWNSSQASTAVTMNSNVNITANFTQNPTWTLTMAVNGNGSTNPGVGSYPGYPSGTIVSISATPAPGWIFAGWTGPVWNSNASTAVTINSNVTVTANFTPLTYNLFMDTSPNAGGSTTPAVGSYSGYAPGTVVPVSATPAAGWTFVNWTGPVAAPNTPSTTVTINSDTTVVAHFAQSYTLTMAVAPAGAGTTTPPVGSPTAYTFGAVVSITATPAAGWYFVNWTGPVAIPNTPSTTVTLNSDVTVTANFTQTTYTLTMAANPPAGGTTLPGVGVHPGYAPGTDVGLLAAPSVGWTFAGWTGPSWDQGIMSGVTMNSNITITANFVQTSTYTLTMAVSPAGSGTTIPGAGVYPGYAPGMVVNIEASPFTGWTFVNWTGPVAVPANAATTVTMNSDVTVTANFSQSTVTVETDSFPNSVVVATLVSPSVGLITLGPGAPSLAQVKFEGPSEGDAHDDDADGLDEVPTELLQLDLVGSVPGVLVRESPTRASLGQIEETANSTPGRLDLPPFAPSGIADSFFDVFFELSVDGGATWLPSDAPLHLQGVLNHMPAAPGDTYYSPLGGIQFTGPGGTFELQILSYRPNPASSQTYTLTMAVNGNGSTTPAVGPHTGYAPGTVVPVSATPLPGWTFVNWTGPVAAPNTPSTTVTMNADTTVTAVFVPSYTLTMVVAPAAGGTTIPPVGAPTGYTSGAMVNIVATPALGWTFAGWSGPVWGVGQNSAWVTMNSDITVTANFFQTSGQTYDLTIATAPVSGGTTTPAEGSLLGLAPGTVVNISATPNPGWTFMFWTTSVVGSVADENAASTTVTVNAHMTVMANFIQAAQTYTLTMAVDPPGSGTTTPATGAHPGYVQGAFLDITATPTEGWAFANWTTSVAGSVANLNASTTTVTVNSDTTVTAHFAQNGPDAPLALSPSSNDVMVGQVFNVTISTSTAAGQLVSAVDAFVDFDPAKLEVIDADPDTEGIQIARGASPLTNTLNNVVDNSAGTIDYSGGKLTSPPSGSFLVATISFRALEETATPSPITFSLTEGRTSLVAYNGSPVSGTHTDASAAITFDIPLSLLPATNAVTIGQVFPVTINTNAPAGTNIDAVDAYVNFDPSLLEVVDADPATAGMQIAPGTELTAIPFNEANNSLGQIRYRAAVGDVGDPSGSLLVATINFRAKAETEGTPIRFSLSGPRQSNVTFLGNLVPGAHANSAAVIVYDVPLSLTASGPKAYVDTTFTVTVQTNATTGELISAVDAFVDFDPVYLEVVDADPATDGVQISPTGSPLNNVLNNVVDNDAGTIDFSSGKLSSPPSGSFLVATITFRAKVETSGTTTTPINISLATPRKSLVAYSGSPVAGSHVDTSVDIDPGATIYGHVTLQGGSRPAAKRVVELTVKLFPTGQYTGNAIMSGTPAMTYTPSTVDTGSNNVTFQIDGVIAGTYDILVVTGHSLHSVKRGVVVSPPSVDVYFGNLLEGNANNDNIINALDFSILAAAYMKSNGQAGWNAGADFDMTGTVNALDFSLLAANYMKSSPQTAP